MLQEGAPIQPQLIPPPKDGSFLLKQALREAVWDHLKRGQSCFKLLTALHGADPQVRRCAHSSPLVAAPTRPRVPPVPAAGSMHLFEPVLSRNHFSLTSLGGSCQDGVIVYRGSFAVPAPLVLPAPDVFNYCHAC